LRFAALATKLGEKSGFNLVPGIDLSVCAAGTAEPQGFPEHQRAPCGAGGTAAPL